MEEKMTREQILEEFRACMPAVFSRKEAERLTGGLISARSLANLDCKGYGPSGRIRIGTKVGYLRGPFLIWLADRLSFEN